MNLMIFKNSDQRMEEALARLEETDLNITGTSGKICRLFLTIINSVMDDAYDVLTNNFAQVFLSAATGEGLDAIGTMMQLDRMVDEDDEDYRYRIAQSRLTAASANMTSIRLAALSTVDVQDVIIKEFTYGAGSFSIYIISDTAITSQDVLDEVKYNVDRVKASGIKYDILTPTIKDISLNIVLSFSNTATENDKIVAIQDSRDRVINYINSLTAGDGLVIEDITDGIIDSNTIIKNAYISSLRIDDIITFVADHDIRWNQRFLASTRDEAITIQGA